MKKIIITAALLGSVYFTNAQVGIGTSAPANASQLDIVATNKGVLIPRVELTNTTTFAPITGDQTESLLVYNNIERNDVSLGYYYWSNNQWNRVVNQADLDEAAGYNEGDVIYTDDNGEMVFQYFDGTAWQNIDFAALVTANETKTFFKEVDAANGNTSYLYFSEQAIIDWLAADSNNTIANIPDASASFSIDATEDMVANFENILSQSTDYNGGTNTIKEIIEDIASKVEGNVVYKNLGDTTNPDWAFQYWDGTQYQTINLGDLVTDAESKTTIVTDNGKQFYVSETYLAANGGTAPTTVDENNIPAGIYLIDVVGGVVNNFDEIINNEVTVNGNTYNTVEEYIEYISQNAHLDGDTKIVIDSNTGQASLEMWDGINNIWAPVNNDAFETIVTENESDTSIIKNTSGDASTGDLEITYAYFNEADPNTSTGTPQATMDVNADIQNLIEGNTDIQNAITNILNEGGNVYYGDHDNDGNTPDLLYTVINSVNTPIDMTSMVVNAIINANDTQKQEIKNELGDTYSTSQVENTGNKWIDGNFIYTGVFTATVTGSTANVTTITLTPPTGESVDKVLSIRIINSTTGQLMNVATTDVAVTGNDLDFKIGTGNMYQVLGPNDIDIHVVVDFTATP